MTKTSVIHASGSLPNSTHLSILRILPLHCCSRTGHGSPLLARPVDAKIADHVKIWRGRIGGYENFHAFGNEGANFGSLHMFSRDFPEKNHGDDGRHVFSRASNSPSRDHFDLSSSLPTAVPSAVKVRMCMRVYSSNAANECPPALNPVIQISPQISRRTQNCAFEEISPKIRFLL
jgi:hypothetical protein